jgi:hypothetical protein
MTMKDILAASLISNGTDKSIMGRFLRKMLDGKVGVAEAQSLAEMWVDYRDFIDSPDEYKGGFRELFETLGYDFEAGIKQYAELADLGNADEAQVILDGAAVLGEHLDSNTPLDEALALYGHSDAPSEVSHDREDIITAEAAPPDRILRPEDGYSQQEIAALNKYAEES